MHSDVAISVKNLTKTYRIFGHPGDRIKQFFSLGLRQYHREFTALKDVSLEIRKGETVGIIGRNGAGKSTLLQAICGIIKPTSGMVQVNGRISALLELGAGFNPEFTGRENIYFQGAIMGLSRKQMNERLADIMDFAGIAKFIDQPVRTYSSGMFVRLAFSVAVHIEPDILIVDEALGVGDAEFQERSISRMKAMQRDGATIIFVSHSIPSIRNFCHRAVWLEQGEILQSGDAGDVCLAYQEAIDTRLGNETRHQLSRTPSGKVHPSGVERTISIIDTKIDRTRVPVGTSLTFHINLHFSDAYSPDTVFGLGLIIRDDGGKLVAVFNTIRDDLALAGSIQHVRLTVPSSGFIPGRYWVSVNVCDQHALFPYDEVDRCLYFEVPNELSRQGIPRWEGEVACEHAWHW